MQDRPSQRAGRQERLPDALAPVPRFFAPDSVAAIERAVESARTAHGAPEALDACRYFAALLLGAVQGRGKEELLGDHFDPTPGGGYWGRRPFVPKIAEVAAGSFQRKEPSEIRGAGYVVDALEAALWRFGRGASSRTACGGR